MEEKIKGIYKAPVYRLGAVDLITLGLIIGFTSFISLFLGTPYTQIIYVGPWNFVDEGWFVTDRYIFYGVLIASVVLSIIIRKKRWEKALGPIRDILYVNCDVELFLKYSTCGIEYASNLLGKKYVEKYRCKVKLVNFEEFYVEGLNAKGKYNDALEYLEKSWKSPKQRNKYYLLLQKTRLFIAYHEKDIEFYKVLLEKSLSAIKKDKIVVAKSLILQDEYGEAIKILEKLEPKYCYEKVEKHYIIANCYMELNDAEKAKEYIGFVIENGNNTMIREKALELFEEKNYT